MFFAVTCHCGSLHSFCVQFEVIEAVGGLVPEEAWRLLNDRYKTHPAVRSLAHCCLL
jgi:hypothetical protein